MKNKLDICLPSGQGHYKIGILYYGKLITHITNNMTVVDDYKDGLTKGYKVLRDEIIRNHKTK